MRRATQAAQGLAIHVCISIHALLAESDILAHPVHQIGDQFLSTLSLRRATDNTAQTRDQTQISIHALLAESDHTGRRKLKKIQISIHALLAESDSAPSANGGAPSRYFYPRSPCGERRGRLVYQLLVIGISIHALLAESDPTMQRALGVFSISIHALLAESDLSRKNHR